MMNSLKIKLTLFLFLSFLSIAVIAQQDKPLVFKNLFFTQAGDGISCYRIPSLVTAPNGDLIAAIDQRVPNCGDLNRSKDINIVIRRSADNGKSWSALETAVDYPFGQSASDPSMIVDQITGAIFLFFNYMNLDTEKDSYYLQVIKSIDNGKTWTKPKDITSQIAKPEWQKDFKFITSGRGIQTSSGKLVHTLVNLKNGLFLFSSDDHGETWNFIDTPIMPADESKIVELVDGTWMINSRVNNKGFRFVHTSKDFGKTWLSNPDSTLVDPGCNASIIRYTSKKAGNHKNRLLFANANDKADRKNLTIKISYDEGKTWSKGKTIYSGSSAYSSMTVLANGDIGLFFEKENYKENVFASFSLNWLTNGKDKYKKTKK